MMDVAVSVQGVFVHLTDFHVRDDKSVALERMRAIAGKIGSLVEEPTEVVILLTGDIAFSGKASQYKAVSDQLLALREELLKWRVTNVHFIASPGNHDCDFGAMPNVVRDALLASPDIRGSSGQDILRALAQTQSAYFDFLRDVCPVGAIDHHGLVTEFVLDIAGFKVKILSLNTSWSSKLEEKAGSLRMPSDLLPVSKAGADYCIVLAHHPLNWFNPSDAVHLSEWLDANADLVLWGHEHRVDEFTQTRTRLGSSVSYQIGLPMDDSEVECGFRCLVLDPRTQQKTEYEARFGKEGCKLLELREASLQRNDARGKGAQSFSQDHLRFLEDPGAGFSHPRVSRQVVLSDLFVSPEFREFKSDKGDVEKVDASTSLADICADVVANERKTVVFGQEASGKSTFAKHLIGNLRSHRIAPVYLDGLQLKSLNKGEIKGWYNSSVTRQYVTASAEDIRQTPPNELCIILDNLHSIPGGSDGIEVVLNLLLAKATRIVMLTADNPAVSLVTAGQSGEEAAYWKGAVAYELLPLGHKRRGELIRKWVSLGRDPVENAIEIEAEVRQVKRLLDKMLGKNSLPKYPLFVLALLQQLEGMKGNKTAVANGSHGYLFEALISQAIDRYVRSHEIGTVNDFLSELARDIWTHGGGGLSQSAVEEIINRFLKGLVSIDGERLQRELDDARIVVEDAGLYRFRYQYLYYYYLAKWICKNASSPDAISLLDNLVEFVHTEQSSNTLMFVAHLKHEQLVLERLVPLIDSLFADSVPRTLESYSNLSLRFRTNQQRAVLMQGPARDVSDAHHQHLDQFERSNGHAEAQVEDGLKFNTTLKTIHTLGQVLKSRATSIAPDQKILIAKRVVHASRRLMSFMYSATEENAEAIVHAVSDAFERSLKLDREEAVKAANGLIGVIVGGIAEIGVGRVADALGSAELKPLLDHLRSELGDDDSQLMLLVAKIVGEKHYPKEEVEDYARGLKAANVLPLSVLANTVARRFYLDPPERGVRDSACKLLNIDVKPLPGRLGSTDRTGPPRDPR